MPGMRPTRFLKAALVVFIALFIVFLYTVLHEGGHALAALLSGGRVEAFNVNFLNLSAHVRVSGEFTTTQRVINNLAGVGLPFLVWAALISAAPRRGNPAVELLKLAGSLGVINSLLVWIIFPFLYLANAAPSDDATNFLTNSGIHPLLAAAIFLAVYVAGWALFLARMDPLPAVLARLRSNDEEWLTPQVGKTAGVMIVVLVAAGLTAFWANGFRLTTGPRVTGQPPAGYRLVNQLELSSQDNENEEILSFRLEQEETAGIFLVIRDINTTFFEVLLYGPGDFRQVLLHAEGYYTQLDTVNYRKPLAAGEYRLQLTSRQSPGTLKVYSDR